jgi:hypothetical protein
MEDFIFAPIVLMVGIGVHAAVLRQHTAREGKLLTLSFAMHLASAVGQVLLTQYYFKGGDMFGYFEWGVPMADALRSDFELFAPSLVQAFFRAEYVAPLVLMPGGGTTQSMAALSIFLLFALGNSIYATTMLIAVGSYLSKVLLYRALRPEFPPHLHRYVQIGATMLPSAVFWSSALLKEPVVMAMIGPSLLGLRWVLASHRRALALAMIAAGVTMIAVIKPYLLMALSIGSAVFYLWARLLSRDSAALKPFAVITASAIAFGGLVLGNRYFSKSEADSDASAFASHRQSGYGAEGGSNFSIEMGPQPEQGTKRSVAYEFLLAPFAVFTSLFRPLLFEARNAVQLANAIEATALLLLFVQILRRRGFWGALRAVRASPTLMFCAVFTLALALGTGLATTNMGTLSRYRAPMMPFFFVLLMVLRYEAEAKREAEKLGLLSPAAAAR